MVEQRKRTILGISAFYHDAAAALIQNGAIIAAAQEERFTRKKHDPSFPKQAIEFCLEQAHISLADVDAIVFYDKPFLKLERLIETYLYFAPQGLKSFLSAIPVWIKEKMHLQKLVHEELSVINGYSKKTRLLFSQHHLSHAASAFYPSGFSEAAILTIDGVGEWATASIAKGVGKEITLLKELHFPHSVGLLYSAFTYYLGFVVNSGEYKLMGLAPYGNHNSKEVENFKTSIYSNLVQIFEDGSIRLNQDFFSYASGLNMVPNQAWEKLFGFPRRNSDQELEQRHCDLALAIQQVTEEIVVRMAKHAKKLTNATKLCMAGGVALNCVANGRLMREGIFEDIWVQPAAGDAGGALGAALAVHHVYFDEPRGPITTGDTMQGAYLGPAFDAEQIQATIKRFQANAKKIERDEELYTTVATALADGKIIGWFQGRMEWGPRALGNRSILGDARLPDMQKRMNISIKYREGFRPFAPSILAEDVSAYFEWKGPSPYMLMVANVVENRRRPIPEGIANKGWKEKLYVLRSDIPAVTHLDYSARLQTVHRETNERYWLLLQEFKRQTSYSLLVNTSFNVRGEPIVCTPDDAYRCFMRTEMDILVIGNYLFEKQAQPKMLDSGAWKQQYGKD